MGYRCDVYACIDAESLPRVIHEPFVDYCEITLRENDLILFTAKDVKLYGTGDWWDNFKSSVEQAKTFHWLILGEDGHIEENYSEYLIETVTNIIVPEPMCTYIPNTTETPVEKELINFLSLVLAEKYRINQNHSIDCLFKNVNGTEWYKSLGKIYSLNGTTYLMLDTNYEESEVIFECIKKEYTIREFDTNNIIKVYTVFK